MHTSAVGIALERGCASRVPSTSNKFVGILAGATQSQGGGSVLQQGGRC